MADYGFLQPDGTLNGSFVQYTAPVSATDTNPYGFSNGRPKEGMSQAYYQFENDKNLLRQGKPVQTLDEVRTKWDKNGRYTTQEYQGIQTIMPREVTFASPEEKAQTYQQIASKYSPEQSIAAGVPQSYVDQAIENKQIAAAKAAEVPKYSLGIGETQDAASGSVYDVNGNFLPAQSMMAKGIKLTNEQATAINWQFNTSYAQAQELFKPNTPPTYTETKAPFISSTTSVKQPTGAIDIPFLGPTMVPILSDINKNFQQPIKETISYKPTTEGMTRTVETTPLPSNYDNFNEGIRNTLHLPDPNSDTMKGLYKSGEVYFALNPITAPVGMSSLASKYINPAITSALPEGSFKTMSQDSNKMNQKITDIINPVSSAALKDYYTPVYQEPAKAAIMYGLAAGVPMVGGTARVAGATDAIATNPTLYSAYATGSRVVTTALTAGYANYVSKSVTGTDIGDVNKGLFGYVDENGKNVKANPSELFKGIQERFPGIDKAVTNLRAIGVTEAVPMYFGYTHGAAASDIGVGMVKTAGAPKVDFTKQGYLAEEGYVVGNKGSITTDVLKKSLSEGTFAVPESKLSMYPDKPLTRIPEGIKAPEGRVYAYSGSESNYLKQGFVGAGHSEVEGMFVSPKGYSYFAKPNAPKSAGLGIASDDFFGIMREPTMFRVEASNKVKTIPEDILNSPTKGNTNDPFDPRNVKISEYLRTEATAGDINVGMYGKNEFQGHIRVGSEVASSKVVGYYNEGMLRVPIREIQFSGKVSGKYSLPVKEVSPMTGEKMKPIGKMYSGADISVSKSKVSPFSVATGIRYSSTVKPSKISSSVVTSKVSSPSKVYSSVVPSKVISSVVSPVKSSVVSPIRSSMISPVKSSVVSPVKSSYSNPFKSSVTSPVKSSITSPVKSSITSLFKSSIVSPIKSSITSPTKSSITSPFKSSITYPSKSTVTTSKQPTIDIFKTMKTGDITDNVRKSKDRKFKPNRMTEIHLYGSGLTNKQLKRMRLI